MATGWIVKTEIAPLVAEILFNAEPASFEFVT